MNQPETKPTTSEVADERTTIVFDRWLKPGESYEFTENGIKFTAIPYDPADPVNRPIIDGTGFIYHWEPPPPERVYTGIAKRGKLSPPDPFIMPDDEEEP